MDLRVALGNPHVVSFGVPESDLGSSTSTFIVVIVLEHFGIFWSVNDLSVVE